MTIRAVFFDFDGTLADSYAAITASVNHVRATHGLGPMTEEEVRPLVGRGLPNLLLDTVPGTDLAADAERYRAHHPSVLQSGTRLLPGVAQTLVQLKSSGIRLGVCSNKPRLFTLELLKILHLESLFEAVIGPEDVARPKPAPDMLLLGMSRLDVTPSESLYVGDMAIDIQTARAAQVPVWVIATGSHDRATLQAAQPDGILQEFRQLLEILDASRQ